MLPKKDRRDQNGSYWPRLRATAFTWNSFIAILLSLTFLSGMMLAFAMHQTREVVCNPQRNKLSSDDGFWVLLSQLFLQALSAYCALYPVANDEKRRLREGVSKINKETLWWFKSLLIISILTSTAAVIVYPSSWKVATALSFLSGFSIVVATAQLARGLDDEDKRKD